MSAAPQQLDEYAKMQLTEVRETIRQAVVVFRAHPTLYRALNNTASAIDDTLGRPRDLPNRRTRRQGR